MNRRVGHKQRETERVIYRYESQDELWATFQINHEEIAENVNKKSHKVHIIVFQTHAPREMYKE